MEDVWREDGKVDDGGRTEDGCMAKDWMGG